MPEGSESQPEDHQPLTPWEILGIPPGSGKKVIRRAFRQQAEIVHPDKNPPGERDQWNEKFKILVNARDSLLNLPQSGREAGSRRSSPGSPPHPKYQEPPRYDAQAENEAAERLRRQYQEFIDRAKNEGRGYGSNSGFYVLLAQGIKISAADLETLTGAVRSAHLKSFSHRLAYIFSKAEFEKQFEYEARSLRGQIRPHDVDFSHCLNFEHMVTGSQVEKELKFPPDEFQKFIGRLIFQDIGINFMRYYQHPDIKQREKCGYILAHLYYGIHPSSAGRVLDGSEQGLFAFEKGFDKGWNLAEQSARK